jgi:hypothetical protein
VLPRSRKSWLGNLAKAVLFQVGVESAVWDVFDHERVSLRVF